jgi:imidazolonepropionase-like amidohydrolase
MKIQPILICCIFLVLVTTGAAHADDAVTAIKAGQIITISGKPIANGVILVKDGKIAEVGSAVKIPDGANVIDASSKVVMPGLVNATPIGIVRGDDNEQSSEITPTFRISAALDPKHKSIKRARQLGVTSFYVAPGSRNLIGGLGVVVKPRGRTAEDMIVKDDAAMFIMLGSASTYGNRIPRWMAPDNFYFRRPTTRMSVAWMLRDSFAKAQKYTQTKDRQPDAELDIIAAALKGDIPIHMGAFRSTDIRMAMSLAAEYGFKATLFGCTEGHQMAKDIAAAEMSAVLMPQSNSSGTSYYAEAQDIKWNNAQILSDAGINVALAMDREETGLLTIALFAVRHGMPPEKALRAITLSPAEILGVSDRLGSIEKGKDADLLILSGQPLAGTTRIEKVIIDGKTVHQAD